MKMAIATLLLVFAAGCGGSSPHAKSAPKSTPAESVAPDVFTTIGSVLAPDVLGMADDALGNPQTDTCEAMGGKYGDIHTGGRADLRGANGLVVANAPLERVTKADVEDLPKNVCAWTMTFESVPAGKGPYTATIGSWSSDKVTEEGMRAGKGPDITIN